MNPKENKYKETHTRIHIIVKFLKTNEKETNFESTERKMTLYLWGKMIWMTLDFSSETTMARVRGIVFKGC